MGDILQNRSLASTSQECQDHENRKILRNCHRLQDTWETRHLSAMWIVDWILERKEDRNGKTGDVQIKSKI